MAITCPVSRAASYEGKDIRETLADFKARVKLDAVALMVIALQTALENGGKLAEVLERISHSLEEQQRVARKPCQTDTAAGRLMVTLMAAFPAAFSWRVRRARPSR